MLNKSRKDNFLSYPISIWKWYHFSSSVMLTVLRFFIVLRYDPYVPRFLRVGIMKDCSVLFKTFFPERWSCWDDHVIFFLSLDFIYVLCLLICLGWVTSAFLYWIQPNHDLVTMLVNLICKYFIEWILPCSFRKCIVVSLSSFNIKVILTL